MPSLSAPVMGMPVTVDIRTPVAGADRLLAEAFSWLRWVDETFSTYRADSQVSRIDRGELDPHRAHPAVQEVIAHCHTLVEQTGGYFDHRATGHFDPSGYVKGWAAERLSRVLSSRGAGDHCVDVGGDIRVRGHATPGVPWRVGIRAPGPGPERRPAERAGAEATDLAYTAGRVVGVVTSDNVAVATSGSYERGEHIINPFTRGPARGLASVTVIGPDLGIADAYATALFAAGAEAIGLMATLPAGYRVLLQSSCGKDSGPHELRGAAAVRIHPDLSKLAARDD